jgi:hypothetical protein
MSENLLISKADYVAMIRAAHQDNLFERLRLLYNAGVRGAGLK